MIPLEKVVEELLLTDGLTEMPSGGLYAVHEDDLEHLVNTIRQIEGKLEVEQLYSVKQVAKILEVSTERIRQLLKDNELEGFKLPMGNYWRVSESALKKFINKRYGDEDD